MYGYGLEDFEQGNIFHHHAITSGQGADIRQVYAENLTSEQILDLKERGFLVDLVEEGEPIPYRNNSPIQDIHQHGAKQWIMGEAMNTILNRIGENTSPTKILIVSKRKED